MAPQMERTRHRRGRDEALMLASLIYMPAAFGVVRLLQLSYMTTLVK
jgi:hypothetical protein